MKLLTKTFRYYLLISVPIFLISSIGFYYFFKFLIVKQVDKSLFEDKIEIIGFIESNRGNPSELYKNITCSYYLSKLDDNLILQDQYQFVHIYDSIAKEYKRFREYVSTVNIDNQNYEMVLHESFVESDSIIFSVSGFSVLLFGLLTLGISFFHWSASRKIWSPFHRSLELMKSYQPGSGEESLFEETNISEFKSLNDTFHKMVLRINKDFDRQKKFIDNISHELQTPLAIASSQLELFMQEVEFNKESAKIVSDIDATFERMKGINKSLLLLSRIRNEQFSDKKAIDINNIIEGYLERYKEETKLKKLNISKDFNTSLNVEMNPGLAEILIGNLIKNAIIHNSLFGAVKIELIDTKLEISNTGNYLEIKPDKLFEKYVSYSQSNDSKGLGLSIVKEICNHYGFKYKYKIIRNLHIFKIEFSKSE